MKGFAFALFAVIAVTGGARAEEWKLVWSDEFNTEGHPDPAKWDYEQGFIRNNESQWYTRARLENARVEDGVLVLECRKEHFTPQGHAPVEYTSASLITQHRASWRYGRIEVRAKLPQGRGVWPAIWMLGANIDRVGWPACGEIDIMEFVGHDPNHIHGTIHYEADGQHKWDTGKLETARPYDDFHVYAIEWSPDRIDFFFDQTRYRSVSLEQAGTGEGNPFRHPFYLLINFALGGEWGGPIDDSILPQKYLIDYVRVYESVVQPAATPNS